MQKAIDCARSDAVGAIQNRRRRFETSSQAEASESLLRQCAAATVDRRWERAAIFSHRRLQPPFAIRRTHPHTHTHTCTEKKPHSFSFHRETATIVCFSAAGIAGADWDEGGAVGAGSLLLPTRRQLQLMAQCIKSHREATVPHTGCGSHADRRIHYQLGTTTDGTPCKTAHISGLSVVWSLSCSVAQALTLLFNEPNMKKDASG